MSIAPRPTFMTLPVALFLMAASFVNAQNTTWRQYNLSNSSLPVNAIPCIESDHQGNKWIGTAHGGLVVVRNDNWTVYNTTNSGIPDNYINDIAFNNNDQAWIGTGGSGGYGLALFDGTTWKSYNASNSPIPVGNTQAVAVDQYDQVWIGSMFCSGGGLINIQGASWSEFNQQNSEFPSNWIRDIEPSGNLIWIATYGQGLFKYDGISFINYNTTNSDIPSNHVKTVAVGHDGLIWVGTQYGLANFDGSSWTQINSWETNAIEVAPNGDFWVGYDGDGLARLHDDQWTYFTKNNSQLAEDFILSIEADVFGEVWVGTMTKGITVLSIEGTATWSAIDEIGSIPHNIFPVPASDNLYISIESQGAEALSLRVFDLSGRIQIEQPLGHGTNAIDIRSLSNGHYLYSLISDDGRNFGGVIAVK